MAVMTGSKLTTRLVRTIHFSTGHRYYNPAMTEEENRKAYGSMFKSSGFGHNFMLEAHFFGPVDPTTGMILDLGMIDLWLKEVTDELDHHYLNHDVAFFEAHVPTAENIARYCFEEIRKRIQGKDARLAKVRVHEGPNLWVDYADGEIPQE